MPRKVYIVGPYKLSYIRLFMDRPRQFVGTMHIEDADIVVFTGGPDINPALYKEKPLSQTNFDDKRDEVDLDAWDHSANKLRVGICRGAQFLNVMNGGTLWQHVDNHMSQGHMIQDWSTKDMIWASSTHHQQMIPGPNFTPIAVTPRIVSEYKESEKRVWTKHFSSVAKDDTAKFEEDSELNDWEVIWYGETSSLCFQPHPEFESYPLLRNYFFNKLGMSIARHERRIFTNYKPEELC